MVENLLIATNGYNHTWRTVEYGAWLAGVMGMKVTLLAVDEHPKSAPIDREFTPIRDFVDRAEGLFNENGLEHRLEVHEGDSLTIIPEFSNVRNTLTVISPLGRSPLKRWLTGRSIRPLMEKVTEPILYVPEFRLPLKKMLVSVGGLEYAESAENLAVRIASANQTDVTILHVVPPVERDYPITREVSGHVRDLAKTDTLHGRNLRKALDTAQKAGLSAEIITREGSVVEQILEETRAGNYDLICMGSPYSARALRQIYRPNVTAEVAESVRCPVLMARYQPVPETRSPE